MAGFDNIAFGFETSDDKIRSVSFIVNLDKKDISQNSKSSIKTAKTNTEDSIHNGSFCGTRNLFASFSGRSLIEKWNTIYCLMMSALMVLLDIGYLLCYPIMCNVIRYKLKACTDQFISILVISTFSCMIPVLCMQSLLVQQALAEKPKFYRRFRILLQALLLFFTVSAAFTARHALKYKCFMQNLTVPFHSIDSLLRIMDIPTSAILVGSQVIFDVLLVCQLMYLAQECWRKDERGA